MEWKWVDPKDEEWQFLQLKQTFFVTNCYLRLTIIYEITFCDKLGHYLQFSFQSRNQYLIFVMENTMQVSKDRGSRKVLELAKMWKKLPPETKQVRADQLGYSIKMSCFYEAIVTYARPIITGRKKMQQKKKGIQLWWLAGIEALSVFPLYSPHPWKPVN